MSSSSSSDDDWDPNAVATVVTTETPTVIEVAAASSVGVPVETATPIQNSSMSVVQQEEQNAYENVPQEHNEQLNDDLDDHRPDQVRSLPGMHRVVCKGHNDAITSLALSNDGSILCSGSREGQLCMWDFSQLAGDMRNACTTASKEFVSLALKPTRVLTPFPHRSEEGQFQAVTAMSWSSKGEYFVACEAGDRPIIIKRNGAMGDRCMRGQQGFLNPVKAVGHTDAVVDVDCSPNVEERFMTVGGRDQTVRLWDCRKGIDQGSVFCVVHGSGKLGGGSGYDQVLCGKMLPVGAATNNPNSQHFITCGSEGLAQLWDERQPYKPGKPAKEVKLPAAAGSIATMQGSGSIATAIAFRCTNDMTYVYDLRKLHMGPIDQNGIGPVSYTGEVPRAISGYHQQGDCNVCTVTAVQGVGSARGGHLVIAKNATTNTSIAAVQLSDDSGGTAVCCSRDGTQLFAGCANGGLYCFYDPSHISPSGNMASWMAAWEEAKQRRRGTTNHGKRAGGASKFLSVEADDVLLSKRVRHEDDLL